MTEMLIVSNVLLWLLTIVLALVVLALARQVGILHERIAPAGALQPVEGPKVGELTTPVTLTDIGGRSITIGGPHDGGLATFVLFISPTCPVCKSLVPTAKSLARKERARLRLVFASDGGDPHEHTAYATDLELGDFPYVLSEALGISYQVSKLPFAVLIGGDGSLESKGLVNTREHLESLIEAMDSGYATVQDYVREQLETDMAIDAPVKEQVS